MTIKDIITLVRAGYTKEEINATLAAAESIEASPAEAAPVANIEAEPGESPAPISPEAPAEDPRIAQLEAQVKELQSKLIQLNSVNTIPSQTDPVMDIANAIINGGMKK